MPEPDHVVCPGPRLIDPACYEAFRERNPEPAGEDYAKHCTGSAISLASEGQSIPSRGAGTEPSRPFRKPPGTPRTSRASSLVTPKGARNVSTIRLIGIRSVNGRRRVRVVVGHPARGPAQLRPQPHVHRA